ncbi:hypothetical protein DPMN_154470 [Dreissena polymorpha]|uniref:Uncharacterized protein n=1 Tax=Dreissena polymorpha TaxID=45954 RepID=A0A9D4JAE2_DREPO|nr:hypothetical protein DPMN_154470 [Dreissena polymorpha]
MPTEPTGSTGTTPRFFLRMARFRLSVLPIAARTSTGRVISGDNFHFGCVP